MPQRITNVSVVVYRDGKRQHLLPNTKFDFTADELKNIESAHDGALRKADSDADRVLDLTKAEAPKPSAPAQEDTNQKEVAPATSDKPLTAAQKKAQEKAQEKAKLADEQKSGEADEGDL